MHLLFIDLWSVLLIEICNVRAVYWIMEGLLLKIKESVYGYGHRVACVNGRSIVCRGYIVSRR